MHALERRDVHEARAVAAEQEPRRVQLAWQRDEAALGNRLRTPLDPLAPVEDPPDERVQLQLLQEVVHGELDVAVVEPDDHPERDHVVAAADMLPVDKDLRHRGAAAGAPCSRSSGSAVSACGSSPTRASSPA